jgi:hypothetical protein
MPPEALRCKRVERRCPQTPRESGSKLQCIQPAAPVETFARVHASAVWCVQVVMWNKPDSDELRSLVRVNVVALVTHRVRALGR